MPTHDDHPGARPPFRADHVGSFLRPEYLLTAREAAQRGALTATQLRAVEDRAIREVVTLQQDVGLHGITDGEFRRTFFHVDFLKQLNGVGEKGGIPVKFRKADGEIDYAPPVMQVTGKVRHTRPIQRRDFEFLKSVTESHAEGHDPVTDDAALSRWPRCHQPRGLSAARRFLRRRGGRLCRRDSRPGRGRLHLSAARRHQSGLPVRCASSASQRALRGDDPDQLPLAYARLINAAIADRPADMKVCIHLCRGNFRSSWAAEGGYEPVARVLFNELAVDGYFLEYDDARSGDFAPLRHVPKGKRVVLGLVTTKLNRLETVEELRRRIDEAARVMPLEQLCLSPQCGFSSTVHGNEWRSRCS